MAKDKPIIRRCVFCFERFDDRCMLAHRKEQKDGKQYCKDTYTLIADGFKQGKTGVWELK